jgi:hypothetical protein
MLLLPLEEACKFAGFCHSVPARQLLEQRDVQLIAGYVDHALRVSHVLGASCGDLHSDEILGADNPNDGTEKGGCTASIQRPFFHAPNSPEEVDDIAVDVVENQDLTYRIVWRTLADSDAKTGRSQTLRDNWDVLSIE